MTLIRINDTIPTDDADVNRQTGAVQFQLAF